MEEGWERVVEGQEESGEVYRSYLKKVCQTDRRTWEGLEVLLHLKIPEGRGGEIPQGGLDCLSFCLL